MSKCAIALSSRENSPIVLKYDYKYCPSCGSAISSPVHVSVELDDPELGFAGSFSYSHVYSDEVTCLRLLCDSCYEKGIFLQSSGAGPGASECAKK